MDTPTILTFTLHCNKTEPYPIVKERVEKVLGCSLKSDEYGDEPAFVGDLLGMKIVLTDSSGVDGEGVYELHGLPDRDVYVGIQYKDIIIDDAILTLFNHAGDNGWRITRFSSSEGIDSDLNFH